MSKTIANIKSKAKNIKRDIFVLVEAYKHPRTPFYIKLLAILVVAYAFSPIDLIPDFIPVLGYLDDVILVPLGILLVMKCMPKDILEECREIVSNSQNVKRKNWIAGTIIILLWVSLIIWLISLFVK